MSSEKRPRVEICCTSAEQARVAFARGADRVELCRDIDCGGLTPTDADLAAIPALTAASSAIEGPASPAGSGNSTAPAADEAPAPPAGSRISTAPASDEAPAPAASSGISTAPASNEAPAPAASSRISTAPASNEAPAPAASSGISTAPAAGTPANSAATAATPGAASSGARPVHVLIRVRPGDFVYSEAEIQAMLRQIDRAAECGAAGVVVGALTADGAIDRDASARLIARARRHGLSVTYHRAIDEAADYEAAYRAVCALGVDRILTSGGAPTAFDGRFRLAALIAGDSSRGNTIPPEPPAAFAPSTTLQPQSPGLGRSPAGDLLPSRVPSGAKTGLPAPASAHRPLILPGKGVTAENVRELLAVTGATEVHGTRMEIIGAVQPGNVQPGAVEANAVQPGNVQPGAVEANAVQPSAVQPNAAKL